MTADIEELLETAHYGDQLATEGITTVAVDDQGQLVRHLPDGGTSVLTANGR